MVVMNRYQNFNFDPISTKYRDINEWHRYLVNVPTHAPSHSDQPWARQYVLFRQ